MAGIGPRQMLLPSPAHAGRTRGVDHASPDDVRDGDREDRRRPCLRRPAAPGERGSKGRQAGGRRRDRAVAAGPHHDGLRNAVRPVARPTAGSPRTAATASAQRAGGRGSFSSGQPPGPTNRPPEVRHASPRLPDRADVPPAGCRRARAPATGGPAAADRRRHQPRVARLGARSRPTTRPTAAQRSAAVPPYAPIAGLAPTVPPEVNAPARQPPFGGSRGPSWRDRRCRTPMARRPPRGPGRGSSHAAR